MAKEPLTRADDGHGYVDGAGRTYDYVCRYPPEPACWRRGYRHWRMTVLANERRPARRGGHRGLRVHARPVADAEERDRPDLAARLDPLLTRALSILQTLGTRHQPLKFSCRMLVH